MPAERESRRLAVEDRPLISADQLRVQADPSGGARGLFARLRSMPTSSRRSNPPSRRSSTRSGPSRRTDADLELVKRALTETAFPVWAEQCNAVNAGCEDRWRATVGQILGL
jgi:hypothetical protein